MTKKMKKPRLVFDLDHLRYFAEQLEKWLAWIDAINAKIDKGEDVSEYLPLEPEPQPGEPDLSPEEEYEIELRMIYEVSGLNQKGLTFDDYKQMSVEERIDMEFGRPWEEYRDNHQKRLELLDQIKAGCDSGQDVTKYEDLPASMDKRKLRAFYDSEIGDDSSPFVDADIEKVLKAHEQARTRFPKKQRIGSVGGVHRQSDLTSPGRRWVRPVRESEWDFYDFRIVDLVRELGCTERQAECFFFYYQWALPQEAIGFMQGITQQAVHDHLKNAKHKLKKKLEGNLDELPERIKELVGRI